MLRTPVALITLAGAAFTAGSLAPSFFNMASLAQPQELIDRVMLKRTGTSAKGDRVAEPFPATSRPVVSIVELVGLDQATIILRSRDGDVLYRSDPRTGLTTVSKDVDLPVITVREDGQTPAVKYPAATKEGGEVPQKQKRRNPVGCVGDVSPLAKEAADRMPSLCLAQFDQSLS